MLSSPYRKGILATKLPNNTRREDCVKDIRIKNGKRMETIMEPVGRTGARIEKEGNWDLSVCIVKRGINFVRIEMSASKIIGGDFVMDPFMEIILKKDAEGHITEAVPVAYQSDNIFIGKTEINQKGEIFLNCKLLEIQKGELDRRLDSWLDSIGLSGYLREPHKVYFREKGDQE